MKKQKRFLVYLSLLMAILPQFLFAGSSVNISIEFANYDPVAILIQSAKTLDQPILCLFNQRDFLWWTELETCEAFKPYSVPVNDHLYLAGTDTLTMVIQDLRKSENLTLYQLIIEKLSQSDTILSFLEKDPAPYKDWILFVDGKITDYRSVKWAVLNNKANWKPGLNHLVFMPDSLRYSLLGAITDLDSQAQSDRYNAPPELFGTQELPDTLDWRNRYGANWMTPIRNQRSCGSCWAFGAVGAMEASIKIGTGDPNLEIDLSEQTLVSECFPEGSCDGGLWPGDYFLNPGIPDEGCYPYLATNSPCERCTDWHDHIYRLDAYYSVYTPTIEQMKSVCEHNPSYVSYSVYADFSYYTGGVYEHLWGEYQAGHAVTLAGWNDTDSCWIIKNSWGDWGEDGYFRIKWGQCDIERQAHFMYYSTREDICHQPDPYEPDNNHREARSLEPSNQEQISKHTIAPDADNDYFIFRGEEPDTFYFWSSGYEDLKVEIFDREEITLLAESEIADTGGNFSLLFTPCSNDSFLLAVKAIDSLQTGCYNLHYFKNSPEVPTQCGSIRGYWGRDRSPYYIGCDVYVPEGQTLVIEAGTEVIFTGHYSLYVQPEATLKAIGTATDSIIFTALNTNLADSNGGWFGIRFDHAHPACSLAYCRIEYGNANQEYFKFKDGGGIYCYYSSPAIIFNTIQNNRALGKGGGISCCESSPLIKNNLITNNHAKNKGGGIYCWHSFPLIQDNRIVANVADSNNASGGGIFCCKSSPEISRNIITNNTALLYGGGIFCYWDSSPAFKNNIIAHNYAYQHGGGLYLIRANSLLLNNTIAYNQAELSGGAVYLKGNLESNITNTIFYANEAPVSPDIHFDQVMDVSDVSIGISYCNIDSAYCFFEVENVDIDWGAGNISEDPQFQNPESNDYQLAPGSPCIDAGDPNSNLDVDGTPNDMGAYGGGMTPENFPDNFIRGEIHITTTFTPESSPYIVVDDLVIMEGCTLFLEAGTEMLFHYRAGIEVQGVLLAIGTETDSIKFSDYTGGGSFSGLLMLNSTSPSNLHYCRISGAKSGEAGIECQNTSPIIEHCTISNNKGGISCYNSSASINHSHICKNESSDNGGGIRLINSDPTIENNHITDNLLTYYNSKGGGIYCDNSHPSIRNNYIQNNLLEGAEGMGGGIYLIRSNALLENNLITGNQASRGGGLTLSWQAYPLIMNNTISGNIAIESGGGIFSEYLSEPLIINTILYSNSSALGAQFYNNSYNNVHFYYCCLDSSGLFSTRDSGTVCNNSVIFQDPLFTDSNNEDYTLNALSPCREAGIDSFYIPDRETTYYAPSFDITGVQRPQNLCFDIGAFEYNEPEIPPVTTFNLNIFPNPFNQKATILFQIPQPGRTRVTIYNLLGNRIETAVDEYLETGLYSRIFLASDLATGLYFCKFDHPSFSRITKLIILK
ncbi:right-handed parallel beta-helix repeat-containing protein [bacterium]|nr:right-handed parallel beta-helix repeat-containing protein [bacterium]